jgi:hypothetical protein
MHTLIKFVCNFYKKSFQKKNPSFQSMIKGENLPVQSTSRLLDIMVIPKSSIQWEYKGPTGCVLVFADVKNVSQKNLHLIPDVKESDVVRLLGLF